MVVPLGVVRWFRARITLYQTQMRRLTQGLSETAGWTVSV
jgi:hypothetical protein